MTGPNVQQGIGNTENLLKLLNSAFEGWGDRERLDWKYTQYPGFDQDHVFQIRTGDGVVAHRRLFEKKVKSSNGETFDCFVIGDGCVSKDRRGQGLYSRLHESTMEYCKSVGAGFCATFNRKGGTTFKANLDRGWSYRTLPVRLRVLSPETVIPEYAFQALENRERIAEAISTVPSRLYRLVPNLVVASLVEVASDGGTIRSQLRRASTTEDNEGSYKTHAISQREALERLEEIKSFYQTVLPSYNAHFSREQAELEHLYSHPNLAGIALVEDGGEIVGIAPVAAVDQGDITEGSVLDFVVANPDAVTHLQNELEGIGRRSGADLLVTIADYDLGAGWAMVDKQVLMWCPLSLDEVPISTGSFYAGMYDAM